MCHNRTHRQHTELSEGAGSFTWTNNITTKTELTYITHTPPSQAQKHDARVMCDVADGARVLLVLRVLVVYSCVYPVRARSAAAPDVPLTRDAAPHTRDFLCSDASRKVQIEKPRSEAPMAWNQICSLRTAAAAAAEVGGEAGSMPSTGASHQPKASSREAEPASAGGAPSSTKQA